jgi:VIT1/CCC1 family predicted Fe2+/Mn2+ transporter
LSSGPLEKAGLSRICLRHLRLLGSQSFSPDWQRGCHVPRAHVEKHFQAADIVRDVVIGMSDGLTVPFALAAGLSGAAAQTSLIVTAGLAEIAAGSIAMGLGGYLAARGDAEHYFKELRREHREVKEIPEAEKAEVRDIFRQYGLNDEEIAPIISRMQERPDDWVNFMMRFELGIEEPDPKRAAHSALTIAFSYIVGGLIPLAPYMILTQAHSSLLASIAITLIALFFFGYVKGKFTGSRPLKNAVQTLLIGGLAASAAFGIAALVAH